ncbi:MAG: trypsin-like serine protease [Methylocapsa sp.]|nr:trypsin-like serine protease [Methylocapsa sp.]
MNKRLFRDNFHPLWCGAKSQLRFGRLRLALLCLCSALLALPAGALVGPAQDAPQFAPYAVVVLDQTGGGTSFCTASVVAQNVVLTAAHCVGSLADTKVRYRISSGPAVVGVEKIAINPQFKPEASNQGQFSIDLALLLLSEPLPSQFRPVQLAGIGPVRVGQRVVIAGFGITDENGGTAGALRAGVLVSSGPKTKFAVLIDPRGTGLGGCTGDSGAPVFAGNEPRQVAVAIKANGEGGYNCGANTAAVQLAPQLSWISATLKGWGMNGPRAR